MTIAANIIKKCGGVHKVAEITGVTTGSVYKWTYPKERGGPGGMVPRKAAQALLDAADKGVVDVSAADFFGTAQ